MDNGENYRLLRDLIPTLIAFRIVSGAELVANDFMAVMFNAREVLDVRKKMVHDGYDTIKTITHGKSKDEAGNIRVTETAGERERAKFREDSENVYKTPQQKLGEIVRLLSEMAIGQVMIRSHDAVTQSPVSTPLLGDAWHSSTLYVRKWGMTLEQKRLTETLARIQSRKHYVSPTPTPEDQMRPRQDPPTGARTTPNPPTKGPPKTATAMLAERGMQN